MTPKRCSGSKESVEAIRDELDRFDYLARWARTHDRTCYITGREVTLQDVEHGKYVMIRLNGDSCFGYEVYPTDEHLMDLLEVIVDRIKWEPKLLEEAKAMVAKGDKELSDFHSDLADRNVTVIYDENGRVSEYRS